MSVLRKSKKRQHCKKRSSLLGDLFNYFLALLKDPVPFKTQKLDCRFKYQYAFDRFRTGSVQAGQEEGVVFDDLFDLRLKNDASEDRQFSTTVSSKSNSRISENDLRSKTFDNQTILESDRKFTHAEMLLFFELSSTFTSSELKSAYRNFVRANHPDYAASSADLDPVGYALAQRKVQMANLFKDLLEKAA